MTLLEARDLFVRLPVEDGVVHATQGVSFSVAAGEVFGIAGESGSGKSVLTQAVTGLIRGAQVSGSVTFQGRNLLGLAPRDLCGLRGSQIGMIFQDPLSSLHPFYTIGRQIAEVIHVHERVGGAEARRRVVAILDRVGIADPDKRFDDYPHQFSGGMRQRVMIAMALVLNPPLVIADEPTTALDVTVQAQIISLLDEMRRERGTAIVLITHDLGLLSRIADRVMILYAGQRVEIAPSRSLFAQPAHPYTAALLRSSPGHHSPGSEIAPIPGRPPSLLVPSRACVFAPRCTEAMPICVERKPPLRLFDDGARALCWLEDGARAPARRTPAGAPPPRLPRGREAPILKAEGVRLSYPTGRLLGGRGRHEVLRGIDLTLWRGETLGLVGESGSGKSTLAQVLAGLVPTTGGHVAFDGKRLDGLDRQGWKALRRQVQVVFQDPFGSLNPRRRVGAIIGDPFRIHGLAKGQARKDEVRSVMEMVGLDPEHYNRFPSEFSGGQRQRIGIARALALKPSLVILDEPVSALDVSIQAQILNLLRSLQRDLGLTYLFISHDLAVVRHVCDRIAVMRAGEIVELADTEDIHARPGHPYTRMLLGASHASPVPAAGHARRLVESTNEVAI